MLYVRAFAAQGFWDRSINHPWFKVEAGIENRAWWRNPKFGISHLGFTQNTVPPKESGYGHIDLLSFSINLTFKHEVDFRRHLASVCLLCSGDVYGIVSMASIGGIRMLKDDLDMFFYARPFQGYNVADFLERFGRQVQFLICCIN